MAGPAVSGVNGKVGAFGGSLDDEGAGGVFGSLAVPLGTAFGAQIDGLYGSADGGDFYGVGGHVFWRDPSRGLLGVVASYVSWDSISTVVLSAPDNTVIDFTGADVGKVGIEGEAYLGRVSLEGLLAYQFGTETGIAGRTTVAFYPTDDLRLDLSLRHLEGAGFSGSAGVEWAPPAALGLSLFADASVDEDSDWSAFGGVKLYLSGEQKSLIRRHREDDPEGLVLPEDLYAVGAVNCAPGYHDDGFFCVEDF
jgi:hypothetical protein